MPGPLPWHSMLGEIFRANEGALRWGLPEPWIQTELFAALDATAAATGWEPFPMEVPYVTFGPVTLPKPGQRDWQAEGAVKWVDLCLRSKAGNEWCWVEFKARHAGERDRKEKAALAARDAVRKDAVALMALDVARTANAWSHPDQYTSAYWFEERLLPSAGRLREGHHSFAVVFVQLGGALDKGIWAEDALRNAISGWWETRLSVVADARDHPGFDLTRRDDLPGGHSMLVLSGHLPS